ncbi:hypothetical protein LCGC14_0731980 [marine sediment metagenome]|uniref:Uncharacterized protein n=1 Tax=marine sediment metagenome TaxID=412755 RepID=A0A0F9QU86_9ZZZZ
MRRKENASHKTFNLDADVIHLIEEGSNINAMTQSEFVEFLVNSWDENINPLKNLKKLRTNKKVLAEDIRELEKAENLIMDNLEKVEEWRKMKQKRKPEVIQNLVRVLTEGRNDDAEIIAKNQSIKLGVPALQLIFEAVGIMKKRT